MDENTIWLEQTEHDDPEFLALVGRAVHCAALLTHVSMAHVVHIDNWFGDRWFRFAGKVLGAAGMHMYRLQVPPFHPNRVLSEKRYEFLADGSVVERPCPRLLHNHRSSESNTRQARSMDRSDSNVLYAWYSGNTLKNGQGALMVYVNPDRGEAVGWYAGMEKKEGWTLTKTLNLTPDEWDSMLAAERR